MTKRPRGYPSKAWFHLSRSRRKTAKWLISFGMRGLTMPSRSWFKLEISDGN